MEEGGDAALGRLQQLPYAWCAGSPLWGRVREASSRMRRRRMRLVRQAALQRAPTATQG